MTYNLAIPRRPILAKDRALAAAALASGWSLNDAAELIDADCRELDQALWNLGWPKRKRP